MPAKDCIPDPVDEGASPCVSGCSFAFVDVSSLSSATILLVLLSTHLCHVTVGVAALVDAVRVGQRFRWVSRQEPTKTDQPKETQGRHPHFQVVKGRKEERKERRNDDHGVVP